MEEDKRSPNSQSPSPSPSWLEDEALSGQWEGAVGGSDMPLAHTEEGAFLYMDDDLKYDTDQELSQWGVVTSWEEDESLQELYYWEEEVTVQEHPQCRARRHQELCEFAEDGRAQERSQWRDGRHPEPFQREESVRVQELHQWEDDGVRYQELTQWEEHVTVQELSPREEDMRGQKPKRWTHQRAREHSPWEEEVRGQELSKDYGAQELPQREKVVSKKKLSHWEDDLSYDMWDKPLPHVNAGDPQTCPQEGPRSPSSVGTEGAGQAAPELPRVAPAPLSPTGTDAPSGAAEEEEPLTHEGKPLTPVEEPLSPVEEPVSAEKEPVTPVEEPLTPVKEPLSAEEEPLSPVKEPVSAEEEPVTPVEEPLTPVKEPLSPVEEPLTPVEEPVSAEKEPVSAEEEPVSAEKEPVTPEEEPLSPQEEPVTPREEEAEGSPNFEEQVPPAGTESDAPAPQSPSAPSQALLDTDQHISTEILGQPEPQIQGSDRQPEEQGELEETTAAEIVTMVRAERAESPVPATNSPCSPCTPSPPRLESQGISEQQEEAEVEGQETDEDVFDGERKSKASCSEHELSHGEGDRVPELAPGEGDRESELSQGTGSSVQEMSPGEGIRDAEVSQGEGEPGPELSQREEDVTSHSCDNAWGPVYEEDAHSAGQEGPSSASTVGTEGAGQVARDVPSVAPAPLSPTDTESVGSQSPVRPPNSPSEGSQALQDIDMDIVSDILSNLELEIQGSVQQPEAESDLGPAVAAELEGTATGERTESPVPAPHSPCCLHCPLFIYMEGQAPSGQQTAGAVGSVLASEATEEGAFAEDENDWKFYDELDICKWQWQREGIGYQEEFEVEEDLGSEWSQEEAERASLPFMWDDDSDRELALEDCEALTVHTMEGKPLLPEEDEWDEISVLELSQGEGREERLRMAAAEGLPVPSPREAWAERRAPAPSTPVPLCACPAQLEAQSPRGAAASPAFPEQGAGTRSQGPAPQSPCRPPSPSPPRLEPQALGGQPALPQKRPSLARRALRALRSLFRSCLGGQPQD